tara:strand:+ start:145 stop:1239 length:1095 start_codon:yes stop_codon:yes gene_type:complete
MKYTPPKVDIDLWFFAAAERLEEFSLVRDEILSEQRGKSHLYRRKPKGRSMSESGIKRSLQVFNARINHGERFRNNARIGERRERISQILIDKKTASKAISDFISSECQLVIKNRRYDDKTLFYPISDELLAALIICGGAKTAMNSLEKYHKWHQKEIEYFNLQMQSNNSVDWLKSYSFSMPDLDLCTSIESGWSGRRGFILRLPTASLICNEEEAMELIDYAFSRISKAIKKNFNGPFKTYIDSGMYESWKRSPKERKLVQGYVEQANYRIALGGKGWDTDYFTHYGTLEDDENLENHTILGLLIRKYPRLMTVVEKYGWVSEGGKFAVNEEGEFLYKGDEEDDYSFSYCSPCFWHLSRSTIP